MVFLECVFRFFRCIGLFSLTWKEALIVLLSLVILLMCYMKLLPIRTAAPFAAGMLISNMAEGFSSLPALSLDSELTALLVLLYFLGYGAEAELSWIIRKPSLLLFAIASLTGFFLILAAPFLYAGSGIPEANTVPVMIFIYTSLIPVIQEPFTFIASGKSCRHEKPTEPPDISSGKRLTALLLILTVTGLLVPASLPIAGLYILGSVLKFPRFSALPELMLWLCIGLSCHASVIFSEMLMRMILLGVLSLILGGLSCGLLGRLLSKITDGRLHPDVLRKPVRAASVFGILIGTGVLLTIYR